MPTITELFDQAVRYHQSGNLPGAESLYRDILRADPRNINALHLLGVLTNQLGRFDVGIPLIREAIALNPSVPDFHANLSLALFEQGNLFYRQGHFAQAAECYRQVLRINPNHAKAHNNLGNALFGQGQLREAVASFRQALTINSNHANAHFNLGNVLVELKQFAEATQCFRQATGVNPDHAEAHYHLGLALVGQEQFAEAAECFRQTLRMNPDHADAHINLGVINFRDGQLVEAVKCFRQALRINPDHADVHIKLGIIHFRDGQLVEAEECFQQALRIDPNNATAHFQQGIILWEQGQLAEALVYYRKALKLKPDYAGAHSNLIYTLHYCPDQNLAAIFAECRDWNERHALPLKKFILPHANDNSPGRRLRIGYISPDLCAHPVGRFLLPLLEAHDHGQFEIFCYSSLNAPDQITDRCRSHADGWRPIFGRGDEHVAQIIRQDRIDILVDLTMHMPHNHLLVFARKPAPVQITYLSYCGTTGMDTMDYRLTDPWMDPPGLNDRFYAEQSIRLPDTFWCYKELIQTPPPVAPPALQTGHVTFGCLNNFCKVTEPTFQAWGLLLRTLPESRLLLCAPSDCHRGRVRKLLANFDVSPERLIFVDRMPFTEYFQTYDNIDVALDPFPYGGGTTTFDTLWMGVPVVTLAGQCAVGRGGVSILSNIGLTDWIAQSAEEYVRIAVKGANDLPRLSALRASLRERMRNSPLMDAPRFARNVEAAYREMWRQWCAK